MKHQIKDSQIYPTLDAMALQRVLRYGTVSQPPDGAVLVAQGEPMERFLVVLEGEITVELSSRVGVQTIVVHGAGEFFGDVHSLSGRPSLVSARVSSSARIVTIDRVSLQALMQNDTELGEIFMRAFIMRRLDLLANYSGEAVVLGSMNSTGTLRIREFLTRNGYPYSFIDLDRETDVQQLLDEFQITALDIPVLMRGREVLKNPSKASIASILGLNAAVSSDELRDVTIVGAGPAGLSAAVYAASEGLNALVIEANVPGGQAGSSSRIENHLGFPNGVSGLELAGRAYDQAQKFGADFFVARSALSLVCGKHPFQLRTSEGSDVQSRTVILATGARYRRLPLNNLAKFEGVGIYYGAATIEAQMCKSNVVAVVGGGNSAGQAAVYLAKWAEHVHILIRSSGLVNSMSRYLIRRIEETPNITLHSQTELEGLEGNSHLEQVTFRNNQTGEAEQLAIRHVYLMTGASPNTEWLKGCVALDAKGFVLTGPGLTNEALTEAGLPLGRRPHLLETSLPGVFAVGDVRSGSIKRVASSVGEGSLAINFVHKFISE